MASSSPRTEQSSGTDTHPARVGGWRSAREPIALGEEHRLRSGVPIAPDKDLPHRTDEELLGCSRGTRQAEVFDERVRRYAGELYFYLALYLGDRTLVLDRPTSILADVMNGL